MPMAISIKGSSSMDLQKDMENTSGETDPISKVISSRATEMAMESGSPREEKSNIKGIIFSIESMAMASMTGAITPFTKANTWKTFELVKVNSLAMEHSSIQGSGKMARGPKTLIR